MAAPIGKRTTSPAFQFYPNDFLGDPRVQIMSVTEVGVYWLLIMACWNEPAGLPFDMHRLAATARMKQSQFERIWAGVLHECFELRTDRVFHRRVEKERKKQAQFSKQQKTKADKRWQSHGSAAAVPDTGAGHRVGNALQSSSSSSSSSSENTRTGANGLDIAFQRFKESYPASRRGMGLLEQQLFQEAIESGVTTIDRVMAALDNHKASAQWQDPSKIPNPQKWLREQRWDVVLPPPEAPIGGRTGAPPRGKYDGIEV